MPTRTITPLQGGQLMDGHSAHLIGPQNYTAKVNMRYFQGKELVARGYDDYDDPGDFPENVTLLHSIERGNGDKCTIACTPSKLYRWTGTHWWEIGSGFDPSADRWQAITLNGYGIFNNDSDLPVYYRVEFSQDPVQVQVGGGVLGQGGTPLAFGGTPEQVVPLYELREQGIAHCKEMTQFNNTVVFGNVTELIDKYRSTWMNGGDPYGRVQDSNPEYLTTTPFRIIHSDWNPLRWKLGVPATVSADNPNVVDLAFPTRSLAVGDKINFRETEEDDDAVTVFITNATISAISDDRKKLTLTLDPDDTPVANDSAGFLTRATWGQEIAGYYDIRSDGSPIIGLKKVDTRLVAVRSTGFSTASASEEFLVWDRKHYQGEKPAAYPNLVWSLNDRVLIYRSREEWLFYNLVTKNPEPLEALNLVREHFDFDSYDPDDLFILANGLRSEIWICTPDGTLVYDYAQQKSYTLDTAFTAGGMVYDTDGVTRILLLAQGGTVLRGETDADGNPIYHRKGESYQGRLAFGFWGKEQEEIIFSTLTPHLSSQSEEASLTYQVYRHHTPFRSGVKAAEKQVTPSTDGMMRLHRAAPYFREELRFEAGPVEYAGRTVSYRTVKSIISRHAPVGS